MKSEAHWRRNLEAQHRAEAVDAERKATWSTMSMRDAGARPSWPSVVTPSASLDDVVEHGARGAMMVLTRATCRARRRPRGSGARRRSRRAGPAPSALPRGEIAPDPEALLHAACLRKPVTTSSNTSTMPRSDRRSQSSEKVGEHGSRVAVLYGFAEDAGDLVMMLLDVNKRGLLIVR